MESYNLVFWGDAAFFVLGEVPVRERKRRDGLQPELRTNQETTPKLRSPYFGLFTQTTFQTTTQFIRTTSKSTLLRRLTKDQSLHCSALP